MTAEELAAAIDATCRELATEERAVKEKRYLKSALDHYGTTVPNIRKAVRGALGKPRPPRETRLALVERLWATPIHERRMAAVEVLTIDARKKADFLEAADLPLLERLLRESKTWAFVDALAVHAVGPIVERHPETGRTLDRWSTDDDFWIRRSSMLALLFPLRAGQGDWERFIRFADAMLEEKEFFIRKAIGWILREASRPTPRRVYDWAASRTHRMSGVTLREIVRRLPEEQAKALRAAYKAGRPV